MTAGQLARVLRAGDRKTWASGDPVVQQLGFILTAMAEECERIAVEEAS